MEKNFDFYKNGKIVIKNSILENIDTLSVEELKDLLIRFSSDISLMTSIYIPSVSIMKVVETYAPKIKVRFKTEKSGGTPIIPISCHEFFEGEAFFSQILDGLKPTWTDLQKFKYLYNQLGMMLSYDLNVLPDEHFSSLHDQYSRNIFTSISRNWGVCASFAASYDYLCYRAGLESEIIQEEEHDYVMISADGCDYLTDPTFDSVVLKFGIKTKNFGISKESFIKQGHHLEQTEVMDLEFETLSDSALEELDRTTGYLDLFEGTYTDVTFESMKHLDELNPFLKVELLLGQLQNMVQVGRATLNDYETILSMLLSDEEKIKVVILQSENLKILTIKATDGTVEKSYELDGFKLKNNYRK